MTADFSEIHPGEHGEHLSRDEITEAIPAAFDESLEPWDGYDRAAYTLVGEYIDTEGKKVEVAADNVAFEPHEKKGHFWMRHRRGIELGAEVSAGVLLTGAAVLAIRRSLRLKSNS